MDWDDPLEKAWQPTPVFLPGESHGQRSLVGYTVHGVAQSRDTTEPLTLSLSGNEDPACCTVQPKSKTDRQISVSKDSLFLSQRNKLKDSKKVLDYKERDE